MLDRWVIGTAADVAERLNALAARFDVDEVMVNLVAGAAEADPADRWPARVVGLTALAVELLGSASGARYPVGTAVIEG